ncbi:alanyl-tRNA editing protein, partial [Patescibacteria group bacterium]|nr:alanyl-tRNA editing protein [Patescibacteria group bacterium]
MKIKQIYYENPNKKELGCKILSIKQKDNLFNIILDQTIFYPEGGGQPSDRGTLEGKQGSAKIKFIRLIDGEIVHQAQIQGDLKKGDNVKTTLDWNWRYKHMRIHTGGHLLHDVLMTTYKNLIPLRGSHGKKAYLEYEGKISPKDKVNIESKVNKALQENLEIVTKATTFEKLEKECKFLPPNLPKNKPLRMIKIGKYSA